MASGKLRPRWKTPDGRILEWDYQHGRVEVYDSRGGHMSECDPLNGAPFPWTEGGKKEGGPVTSYRVIMYNRTTDRVGGIIPVPAALLGDVLSIAGISGVDVDEPGEYELNGKQARDISALINFRVDNSRFRYHLEQLDADPSRLRA